MVHSTRSKTLISSSEAILNGLAPDGGLYVFEELKTLDLNALKGKSYQEVAEVVLLHLLDDYSKASIKKIVGDTYNPVNFKEEAVTLKHLDNYSYLNLFNGPTFAFKDMALSILPKLVNEAKFQNIMLKPSIVLTATSGDTGSAALSGFSGNDQNHIIVLYPTEGISEFQEIQMNSYQSETEHIYALNGNFDDCQNIVKELFLTVKPKTKTLTSANSINIGRLVPQVIYYVYSYLELLKEKKIKGRGQLNFCVPTGNFGNIYAAYIARELGVPIKKLIVASNQNNVLDDFFKTGIYSIDRTLDKSMSPSMDIIISSNLERYIYSLLDGDTIKVTNLMNELKENKTVFVKEVLKQKLYTSGYATEEATKKAIKSEFDKSGLIIDTHTAVAKHVYDEYVQETQDKTYTVIVSTASPYKFSENVLSSLGENPKSLFENMITLEQLSKEPVDERILDILTKQPSKKILKKEEAYQFLKKVIKNIDQS